MSSSGKRKTKSRVNDPTPVAPGGATKPKIRDGDRRRRGVIPVRQVLQLKAKLRQWNLDAPGAQDLPDTSSPPDDDRPKS